MQPAQKQPIGCRRVGCAMVLGFVGLMAIIGLIAERGTQTSVQTVPKPPAQNIARPDFQTEVKKIELEYQIDYGFIDSKGRHRVIVKVFNNSAYDFDGHIWVYSKDVSGETLGRDVFTFTGSDKLPSGNWRWANMWLKTWPGGHIEYRVNGSFVGPPRRAPEGTVPVDESATAAVWKKFKENFGAASWFKQIDKVTVYQDHTACMVFKKAINRADARLNAFALLDLCEEVQGVLGKAPDGTELCWVTRNSK